MLSAFQLENNRLTRLEADEIKHLASSVWVDLVEPDDDERSRVQTELGQNLATRPELEDIEASARFFEDEDGESQVFKYRLDHHIAMSKALIVGSAGDQRHLTIALHWAQSTLTNLFIQQIPAVL